MLAAQPEFEVGAGLAAQLGGHLYQLADAVAIEDLERIVLNDVVLQIVRQKPGRVVAR